MYKEPESFQLTINYRSHGGIVRCAHSVVELISRFWPDSIDVLAEEKGMIDGVRPVFFVGKDEIDYSEFFSGTENVAIELGANQCTCTWSYV